MLHIKQPNHFSFSRLAQELPLVQLWEHWYLKGELREESEGVKNGTIKIGMGNRFGKNGKYRS